MEKISFIYKRKKFKLNAKKLSFLEKFAGLMFVSREKAEPLLFEYKKPRKLAFTGLFVFFPFMILWLDRENKVIDIKKAKPFQWNLSSEKPYFKVLEIPFNKKYNKFAKSFYGNFP